MFGYVEESETPGIAHTNRAYVNKRGALFGGRKVWLPSLDTFRTLTSQIGLGSNP